MSRKSPHPSWAILSVGLAILCLVPAARAAEPASEADGSDGARAAVREQTIYIPYDRLQKVFEAEGRGVFLPYEKFRELWDTARKAARPPEEEEPPVGALITAIDNEAEVSEDVVEVTARLKIEVLTAGWHEVPLRLADAAITRATLGDQPARIVSHGDQGYKLLLEKQGDEPEQFELLLEYAKAISRTPGQNSVSFQAPQAPVNRWRIRIPEAGVKVNLFPLIAAAEVSEDDDGNGNLDVTDVEATEGEETVILAFVGAAPEIRIGWTPKAEGATGLEALASVQAEQQVTVSEGVTRTRTQLDYAISRAELPQLTVRVPLDQKVVNVFDANVRQWSVNQAADHQVVAVELFEPAAESQRIIVELEKFAEEEDQPQQTAVEVPVVEALGVGRQQGVLVVQVAAGLRAEATAATGLLQVDRSELPAALARSEWAFSYRYASVPFALQLAVEKIQPRILVDSLVLADLRPEKLALDMTAIYTVQRAGVFRLELDLPPGFEVRDVRGRPIGDGQAAEVDTHHLEGDDNTRLVVNLSRKAMGRVGLGIVLEMDLDQPELLEPMDQSAEIPLPIPRVVPETVERATGRLMILAPESLRVNPLPPEGLRAISFDQALEGLQLPPTPATSDSRRVLAYAYGPEPVALTVAAERRKPQVTVRQLLVARVEDGVVKYEASFFYTIRYSGVKSLRIDVPQPTGR